MYQYLSCSDFWLVFANIRSVILTYQTIIPGERQLVIQRNLFRPFPIVQMRWCRTSATRKNCPRRNNFMKPGSPFHRLIYNTLKKVKFYCIQRWNRAAFETPIKRLATVPSLYISFNITQRTFLAYSVHTHLLCFLFTLRSNCLLCFCFPIIIYLHVALHYSLENVLK